MKSIKEKPSRFKPLYLYQKDENKIKNNKKSIITFGSM